MDTYRLPKPILELIMNENLLRLKSVISRTGLSRSTIYSYISQGRFPEPVKIGERSVAWTESDVQSWIKDRITNSERNLFK